MIDRGCRIVDGEGCFVPPTTFDVPGPPLSDDDRLARYVLSSRACPSNEQLVESGFGARVYEQRCVD